MPDNSANRTPLRLLRGAIAIVVVFAIGMTAWLIDRAAANPDVRARQPGWFEGIFNMPFWLPLILTFVLGAAAVIAVYAQAARRLGRGEDLHANSFRARKWRELEERQREIHARKTAKSTGTDR
jgi:hypothetical protein